MAIYYLCPDIDVPLGGTKVIYKHVDLLNHMGHKTYVLHGLQGFRCTWFENQTPISYCTSLNKEDVVVAPEIMANRLFRFSCRKLIFNQNVYYESGEKTDKGLNPYRMKDLEKILVVSRDNYDFLSEKYPELNISIVRNSIDSGIFSFGESKKKQVAYMTRKNAQHVREIIEELIKTPVAAGWDFVEIDQISELQVARMMQQACIFLATGFPEGFGLPAVEALACGCKVIGYDGIGGREFFSKCHTDIIEYGDLNGFGKKIIECMKCFEQDFGFYREQSKNDSDYILNYYSEENQARDLYRAYIEICGGKI